VAHAAPPVRPPEVSPGDGRAPGGADHLLRGQTHILERIARGAPLTEVLDAIVALIESAAPGMVCSILLLDREGRRLRHGAAPSPPTTYNEAVDWMRACWSTPIISATGRVLGTFAMYYYEPRTPTTAEQQLITTATDLAGIAIERRQAEEALRESEERFSKAFHTNPAPLSI